MDILTEEIIRRVIPVMEIFTSFLKKGFECFGRVVFSSLFCSENKRMDGNDRKFFNLIGNTKAGMF